MASAFGSGPKGRGFKSHLPDQIILGRFIEEQERAKTLKGFPLVCETNIPISHWKGIAGMRDKLIHDYFGVDISAVWSTTRKDIPTLKAEVEQILKDST